MSKGQTFTLKCRQNLFREQVLRFQRLEYRRPALNEIRQIWRETGFKTTDGA